MVEPNNNGLKVEAAPALAMQANSKLEIPKPEVFVLNAYKQ